MPSGQPSPIKERRRLDAWKAIAQYLGRDVTTVRRWEKREGLPVHRHQHEKLGSVYAFADEIDEWQRRRSTAPERSPAPAVHPAVVAMPKRPERRALRSTLSLPLVVIAAIVMSNGPWIPQTGARKDATQKFAMASPPGLLIDSLAVSPDGASIVMAAIDGQAQRLWIRPVESADAVAIKGTEGASFPFWSPDGANVGFFASGRLKRVALRSGQVTDLAPALSGRGGAWNHLGDILYVPDKRSPVMRIPEAGGTPKPLTTIGTTFMEGHAWPAFLPDGQRFLYTDYSRDETRTGIYVGDLMRGTLKRVAAVWSRAAYSPDGYLLYSLMSRNALVAQRFDLDRLEAVGEPFNVAERILHRGELGQHADFSLSRSGTLIVRIAEEERNKLVLVDRATKAVIKTIAAPGYYGNPIVSPDNQRVIASVTEGNNNVHLWTFDLSSGAASALTSGRVDWVPLISSRGDRLLYMSAREAGTGLYERSLVTGQETKLLNRRGGQVPESWSRDGRHVTFRTPTSRTRFDIWSWTMGQEEPHASPLLSGPADEMQSQISPNGRFMAYTSDASGTFEVYVTGFQSFTETWRVSVAGGTDPRWRADGRELYFLGPDGRMMAVNTSTRSTFKSGTPVPLFETGMTVFWNDTRNHYDVTSDGRRFVLLVPEMDRRKAPFTVILNWQK